MLIEGMDMKQSERGNRKLRQLPKPGAEKTKDNEAPKAANQVQALWFDVEGEHRRLYAIRKDAAGKSLFYLDRNEVLDFTGWPNPIPDTLSAADVQTVARMGGQTKGVYLILTRGGGSWGGYLLRRKYQDAERILIPAESEERDAAAHKRPASAERHVPGTFWLSDADKAALDAATTPEDKSRIMHGAELRGWMTPHEHEAWSTARTDSDRQDIERKAAAAMRAEREAEKLRPLPGRACPDCGQLLVKAPYCDAWCPRPVGCGSVFGHQAMPAPKWGKKEDAYLASIEAWLAEPRTRSEIEAMLDTNALGTLYKTFGYAPHAWTRGQAILRAELKKRDMEHEGKTVVRSGENVLYIGKDAPRKPKRRPGKRGAPRLDEKEEEAAREKRIKNAIDAAIRDGGRKDHLVRAAANLGAGYSWREVKRVNDRLRHRPGNLNTATPKRK
jgi:hypothetical protein